MSAPRLGNKVDCFCSSSDEDYLLGTAGVDESRNLRPRLFMCRGGFFTDTVDSTMDVRIVIGVIIDECVDYLFGLLTSRCIIQVGDDSTIHLSVEDWEIFSDLCNIES